MGFEDLAWILFEYTAADQMFVYRASETGSALDPALALGALSLVEKQSFWASQLSADTDPLEARLAEGAVEVVIAAEQVQAGEYSRSLIAGLRARAWIVYPLANREGLLGAVLVGWFAQSAALPEEQRKLARIIAQAMALETDNARLYELAQQQGRQALIAQETTQAILRRDPLENNLRRIANEVMRAVDGLGCAVCLVDEQGRREQVVQVGQPAAVPFDPARLSEEHSRNLLQLQKAILLPAPGEPEADAEAGADPGTAAEDDLERSILLIAPLSSGQKTVGFLELTQLAAYHRPRDLVTAHAFAGQAAVAVELDRLYQRLQQTAVAEERARLARDLHDSISQSIYAMTLYTRAARRKLEDGEAAAVDKYLRDLHTTAREALGEMRLLIYELRPAALERYGLKGILEQRLQAVEARSGLEVNLDFVYEGTLPPPVEENLYHIALEALNNTIKHAQASRVWVSIGPADGQRRAVRLTVRDDGAGFDPAEVAQGGVGLKSIRERVQALNGRLAIETRPGAGVILSVEVPDGENPNPDR